MAPAGTVYLYEDYDKGPRVNDTDHNMKSRA